MCRHAFRLLCLTLLLCALAPVTAHADCACSYDYGAAYCCQQWGYTPKTVQCSLSGYQWSCTDRVLSNPYITTATYAGIGDYCLSDFIDFWVGNTACSFEKASCSTSTPGLCVWTEQNLSCSVYDRPTRSSCGPGGPL